MVLVVLPFLVLLLVLSVEAFVLVSGWEFLSSMGPGLGFRLNVMDLLTVTEFEPFFLRYLHVAGCPPRGEICSM